MKLSFLIKYRVFSKRYFFLALLLLEGFFSQAAVRKPYLVVLDPGHGGSDLGATHQTGTQLITEKDLTLKISKMIAAELKKNQIQAILTRQSDKDLPLMERTAIANRIGADAFISIHLNSYHGSPNGSDSPGGFETYILNNSTNATSKRLADLENSVLQGSIANSLDRSEINLIVKDLILDANLSESKQLACAIQENLVSQAAPRSKRRHLDRGVKQAMFYVLLGADMPSALVETGFINNDQDRSLFLKENSRRKLAKGISKGIMGYLQEVKKGRHSKKTKKSISRCKVN